MFSFGSWTIFFLILLHFAFHQIKMRGDKSQFFGQNTTWPLEMKKTIQVSRIFSPKFLVRFLLAATKSDWTQWSSENNIQSLNHFSLAILVINFVLFTFLICPHKIEFKTIYLVFYDVIIYCWLLSLVCKVQIDPFTTSKSAHFNLTIHIVYLFNRVYFEY